jgi:hypothetical protein
MRSLVVVHPLTHAFVDRNERGIVDEESREKGIDPTG